MDNKEHIVAKWLSGEISDEELTAAYGEHTLKELKQIKDEVDQWSLPSYNTDLGYKKLKDKMDKRTPKKNTSTWLKVFLIVGAISVIAVAVFLWISNKNKILEAPFGESIYFAFQDGSETRLNDGSSINYNKSEWSSQRVINLEGEAFFNVKKGAPFTVETDNSTITVLGTQFNVRSWGEKVIVECYEGSVKVESGDQMTVLSPNERVIVQSEKMKAKQKINNTSPEWQKGVARFYEDNLSDVFNELERQYNISVDLKVNDRIFTGNFEEGDLDKAMRSICKPLGLNYTISMDKKFVVIE